MQLRITKPLSELKTDNYNIIKSKLYNFIIEDSNFPEWKQVNYADTYSDLSIKKLTSSITPEEQTILDNIIIIRSWKNDILIERERVKSLIFQASNMSEIRTATLSMQFIPTPFIL